ncbi:MAG: WD40 repeat domain-containing protein [Chloroflexi bacterium]|nr:WD40 repeat domain-containing protein [Chloroflexota bacterium]
MGKLNSFAGSLLLAIFLAGCGTSKPGIPFTATTPAPQLQPTATLTPNPTNTQSLTPTFTPQPAPLSFSAKRIMRIGMGRAQKIVWASQGEPIVIASTIGLYIYNKSLKQVRLIETGAYIWDMSLHPSGQIVATADDVVENQNIRLWDVTTGQLLQTLEGHPRKVVSVDFSPDGSLLASGSADGSVRIWDVKTGRLIQKLEWKYETIPLEVWRVRFSPDGKLLASGGGDNIIRLWEVKTGKLLYTLSRHTNTVSSIEFSPDGQLLASAGGDDFIQLWEITTGKPQRTLSGNFVGVGSSCPRNHFST